ncbi:MAG: glutathione S-transferase N-terminal domain-containing protein [Candidatus Comchoanobacterales bacterium]
MAFYSHKNDIYSHRTRIVLAEKSVAVDMIFVDEDNPPEEFLQLNPYGTLPLLVDRDLVLNQSNIIMDYVDERFPHPPLLPVYPIARAKSRLMIHRIEQDWYPLVKAILANEDFDKNKAILLNHINELMPVFKKMPYFMSSEFSMIDCCLAPLLWRLNILGFTLDEEKYEAFLAYRDRVFERNSFQASLSDEELMTFEFKDDVS